MRTNAVRLLATVLFFSNAWSTAQANNPGMSQQQTVNIGISNTNTNKNTNTANANAAAAAKAKAAAAAKAKATAKVVVPKATSGSGGKTTAAPKAVAKANSNSKAAAASKAGAASTTKVTSTNTLNNQNTINTQLGQTQTMTGSGNSTLSNAGNSSMKNSGNSSLKNSGNATLSNLGNASLSNSGNASLSNSGNASLSNSGNSQSSSALTNSGNATLSDVGNSTSSSTLSNSGNSSSTLSNSGNSSSKLANSGNSTNSISDVGNASVNVEGDTFVNTYEAPKIPVSSAAPSFATMCTQGMAGQTVRIGFSSSTITMQCKDLMDSFSQLEWMERVWNHINTNYAARLERAEVIRVRLDAQKSQLEEAIAQIDLAKGGARADVMITQLSVINAKLARLDREEARMYEFVDSMVVEAEGAFGRSSVSIKNAHVDVRAKSNRVGTFLTSAANALFAPLGFLAVLKGL